MVWEVLHNGRREGYGKQKRASPRFGVMGGKTRLRGGIPGVGREEGCREEGRKCRQKALEKSGRGASSADGRVRAADSGSAEG